MEVEGIWVLTPVIMRTQKISYLLLPPPPLCSHLMSRQPRLHTTMNSKNNDATYVMRLGILLYNCLVRLQALKDKKGLNMKGALSMGGQKAPKAAQEDHQKHPSHKVRCMPACIWFGNPTPMLNEDALSHWLGRDNVGYATIEGN